MPTSIAMIREEGAVLDVCFQLPFDEKLQGLKGKLYEKIKAHSKNERTFSLYWTTLGEYFVKDWGWNFEKRVGAGAAGKGVYIYGEVLDRILEVGGRDVMDLHEVSCWLASWLRSSSSSGWFLTQIAQEFVMIMEEQFSCQTYIENIDTREGAEGEGDEGEGEEEVRVIVTVGRVIVGRVIVGRVIVGRLIVTVGRVIVTVGRVIVTVDRVIVGVCIGQ